MIRRALILAAVLALAGCGGRVGCLLCLGAVGYGQPQPDAGAAQLDGGAKP